jgi:hypothetical protein
MRLAKLSRVPFHVLIHKTADRICARFKRFHIRPSSIVGRQDMLRDSTEKLFTLPLLAHLHDKNSLFALLPIELIHFIYSVEVRAPLEWVLLDHPKCEIKISNNRQTACNHIRGYRMQPFYSLVPITSGIVRFTYQVDQGTKPATTAEIGICPAAKLYDYYEMNCDSCDATCVREDGQVFMYSWNGGQGYLFGNVARGVRYGGCNLGDRMMMEVDMNRRKLNFFRCPDNGADVLVAEFSDIPKDVIPFCWLLGSGSDASVTLFDSVTSIL